MSNGGLPKRIVVFLDVEGPQVRNDNAFEITVALAEKCGLGATVGDSFFTNMSNIDDIWGDFRQIPQDPSYSSGHTLKVMLPFFRAMMKVSDIPYSWLYEFSRDSVVAVPDVKLALDYLARQYEVWMVSTSYEFFIEAYLDIVNFPFKKAYCTRVAGFSGIFMGKREANKLLSFMEKVAAMPLIEYDGQTGVVEDEHQANYNAITDFVWNNLYITQAGQLLKNVHPIGQTQKANSVLDIFDKTEIPGNQSFYVGDSQTDRQAVQVVNTRGGLSMMFNGKGEVCRDSNLMYIGQSALAISKVAELFDCVGRAGVIETWTPWRDTEGGSLAAVTQNNFDALHKASIQMRKNFRGEAIGKQT